MMIVILFQCTALQVGRSNNNRTNQRTCNQEGALCLPCGLYSKYCEFAWGKAKILDRGLNAHWVYHVSTPRALHTAVSKPHANTANLRKARWVICLSCGHHFGWGERVLALRSRSQSSPNRPPCLKLPGGALLLQNNPRIWEEMVQMLSLEEMKSHTVHPTPTYGVRTSHWKPYICTSNFSKISKRACFVWSAPVGGGYFELPPTRPGGVHATPPPPVDSKVRAGTTVGDQSRR